MTATREKVLAVLEQACRHGVDSPWVEDLVPGWRCDDQAVVWGSLTSKVVDFCFYNADCVRRELDRAHADGLVLRLQRRPRGAILWWPVGLLAKLQAERASAGEMAHG
jgi:hypothetical protein